MTPSLKFEITVCFSCFLCQLIHGHWRGLISRNGHVWPTLFLLDVFTALKGIYNYILLGILRSMLATIVDVLSQFIANLYFKHIKELILLNILCTIYLAIFYVLHFYLLILIRFRIISIVMTRTGSEGTETTNLQTPSLKYAFGESNTCRRGQ